MTTTTTTTTTPPLTIEDLVAGYGHEDWGGFGYLGERVHFLHKPDLLAVADGMILHHANRLGWSAADLFAWANSKRGRWAGDILLGSPLGPRTDGELRRQMTLEGGRL